MTATVAEVVINPITRVAILPSGYRVSIVANGKDSISVTGTFEINHVLYEGHFTAKKGFHVPNDWSMTDVYRPFRRVDWLQNDSSPTDAARRVFYDVIVKETYAWVNDHPALLEAGEQDRIANEVRDLENQNTESAREIDGIRSLIAERERIAQSWRTDGHLFTVYLRPVGDRDWHRVKYTASGALAIASRRAIELAAEYRGRLQAHYAVFQNNAPYQMPEDRIFGDDRNAHSLYVAPTT